jgi:deoxyribodipyrimidine photo-lyase
LIQAIQNSKEILPIFIFDTNILKHCPAKDPRLGFLIDAVNKLDEELQSRGSKLYVFQGDPIQIIKDLIKNEQIEALYANRSYGH